MENLSCVHRFKFMDNSKKSKALVKAIALTEEQAKAALDKYREPKDFLVRLLMPKLISQGIYKIAVVSERYAFVDVVLGWGGSFDEKCACSSFVQTDEVFYAGQEMMDYFESRFTRNGPKKTVYEFSIDSILEAEKKKRPFLMVSAHKKATDYIMGKCDVLAERKKRFVLKSKEHGAKFLFCEASESLESVVGNMDFTYIQVSEKGVIGFRVKDGKPRHY